MASWAFWGVSWEPFRAVLGRHGASRGHLKELLGPPAGILEGILGGQAPKMPPRRPKEPAKASKTLPKRLPNEVPDVSKRLFSLLPRTCQKDNRLIKDNFPSTVLVMFELYYILTFALLSSNDRVNVTSKLQNTIPLSSIPGPAGCAERLNNSRGNKY